MRTHTTLLLILAVTAIEASAAADPSPGAADRRDAALATSVITIETPLYEQPGESSRALARLERGTPVEILRRKGRWLEARSSGKRGWVPRSTVAQAGGDGERPARAGVDRPGGGFRARGPLRAGDARKPVWMDRSALVESAAAVAARAEPDAGAPIVFEVAAGTELRLAGQARGEWSLVESADGTVAWIPAASLRTAASGRPAAAPARSGAVAVEAAAPGPAGPGRAALALTRPRWIRGRAAIGVSSFDMEFTSNGTSPLSASRLSASGMAAFGSAEAGMTRGPLHGSVDASYGVTLGLPGIRVQQADGTATDPLGFTWHHLAGGARLGYRVADSFVPHLRAGYRLDWFRVSDVTNPGMIARDGLSGFLVGVGADAALSDELLVRIGGETLVGGGRKQTPGLEDGLRSSALAFWGRLDGSYLATDEIAVSGSYQYGWSETDWDGQSRRQPDVTDARRTDRSHLLLLSLQLEL